MLATVNIPPSPPHESRFKNRDINGLHWLAPLRAMAAKLRQLRQDNMELGPELIDLHFNSNPRLPSIKITEIDPLKQMPVGCRQPRDLRRANKYLNAWWNPSKLDFRSRCNEMFNCRVLRDGLLSLPAFAIRSHKTRDFVNR